MSNEEAEKIIEEQLLEKLKKSKQQKSNLLDFFPFEERKYIIGKLLKLEERKFRDFKRKVAVIFSFKDKKEFIVPMTTIINSQFEKLEVKEGDYVAIAFEGTKNIKNFQNPLKLFTVAKISEEEIKNLYPSSMQQKSEEKKENLEDKEILEKVEIVLSLYPDGITVGDFLKKIELICNKKMSIDEAKSIFPIEVNNNMVKLKK